MEHHVITLRDQMGNEFSLAATLNAFNGPGIWMCWEWDNIPDYMTIDNTMEVIEFAILEGPNDAGEVLEFAHGTEDDEINFYWSDDVDCAEQIIDTFKLTIINHSVEG